MDAKESSSRRGTLAEPVPCPRCAVPLDRGALRCQACALPLTGPLASQLWTLDQRLADLSVRRAALLQRLAAQDVPAGVPTPPAPFGPPMPTVPSGVPSGRADDAARRHWGAQQLLLATGVLLVVAATVVFSAVVWNRIGVAGQAGALVAVCAAAAAGSRWTALRGLTSSAEALAILAVVVADVTAGSARALDFLGAGELAWGVYWALSLLVIIGGCVMADRFVATRRRLGQPAVDQAETTASAEGLTPRRVPRAYAWAAVLASALLPSALTEALWAGPLTWAGLGFALAAGSVALAPAARGRARGLAPTALAVGATHLGAGYLTVLVVALGRASTGRSVECAAELAVLALVAALAVHRLSGQPDRWRTIMTCRVTAWAAVAGALLALATTSSAVALPAMASGMALLVVVLLAARRPVGWPLLLAAQGAAGLAVLYSPVVEASTDAARTWVTPLACLMLAAAATLTGRLRPQPESPATGLAWTAPPSPAGAVWTGAAAAALIAAAALTPGAGDRVLRLVLVLIVATSLLAWAWVSGPQQGRLTPHEGVLAGAWSVAVLTAFLLAIGAPDDDPSVRTQVVLAVAGVQAMIYAVRPHRLAACLVGVGLLSIAWWVHAADAGWTTVEWVTVAPAALALAVGAMAWHRVPRLGSWAVLGPGLACGVLPSAIACLDETSLEGAATTTDVLRSVVLLLVAVACCLVGVWRGWQAPLVLGAVAGATVAVAHLWTFAVATPLWVALALAGAVVIVVAIRVEQARRDAARAVTWLRALH